ncbi:MAG: hypothetical protein ACRY3E_03945 [Candidatus Lariskella arthropodorum]
MIKANINQKSISDNKKCKSSQYKNIYDQQDMLKALLEYCDQKFASNEEIKLLITNITNKIEIKLAKLHTELFRWFIGSSLAQTSILICSIIALLQVFIR